MEYGTKTRTGLVIIMVVRELIESIIGLSILISTYAMFMPFLNFLRDLTISLGAPAATALFLSKMGLWFLMFVGIACIIYPLMAVYRQTYDQGQDSQFMRR